MALGVAGGVALGVAGGVAYGVAEGVAEGVAVGVALGVAVGVAVGVGIILGTFQIPLFLGESLLTLWLRLSLSASTQLERDTSYLPFRHHELIYLPLPGLTGVLIQVGQRDPKIGQQRIAEAAASLGQKRAARRALEVLQAHTLRHAISKRQLQGVVELSLPFLPGREKLPNDNPLLPFSQAAQDLIAVQAGTSQHHRRERIAAARQHLTQLLDRVGSQRRPEHIARLLLPVAQRWLEEVEERDRCLAAEVDKHRELPTPFRVGNPLQAEDLELFKGRRDLVQVFNHDLAAEGGEPLFLLGQRRVGKSSLLNLLPQLMGSAAVVTINFQGLSGSLHRRAPHIWLLVEVASRFPIQPLPLEVEAWGPSLAWLKQLDVHLAQNQDRLLIAIDEIERLEEDRIAQAVCPDFLDFVRACGEQLQHIRLLLVGAHSPRRLGRHWTDRLISAIYRDLSFLSASEAEELVLRPISDFPEGVYPPELVKQIIEQTHGHPYLVQLICSELVRELNAQRRSRATEEDLEEALDCAANKSSGLFDEIWDERSPAEQRWLIRLAEAPQAVKPLDPALRQLRRESFVLREGECWRVAVPMFAQWIRTWGS